MFKKVGDGPRPTQKEEDARARGNVLKKEKRNEYHAKKF
jgi:hypothetical protein